MRAGAFSGSKANGSKGRQALGAFRPATRVRIYHPDEEVVYLLCLFDTIFCAPLAVWEQWCALVLLCSRLGLVAMLLQLDK